MNETTQAPPTTPRRRVTSTTVITGILALLALGAVGLGVNDYLFVQGEIAHNRDQLAQHEAALARVRYDDQGNVVEEDRGQYQEAMMMMKIHTGSLQTLRQREGVSYPYIGGGTLAFLVFAFIAVRSTRRA